MIFGFVTVEYLIGAIIAILGIGLMVWGANYTSRLRVQKRMNEFIVDTGKIEATERTTRIIITREFSGSLLSRTILPFFKRIVTTLGEFTPQNSIQKINRQLVIAKFPFNLNARSFYGIRIFLLIIGLLIAIFMNVRAAQFDLLNVVVGLAIVMLFMMAPQIWLNNLVKKTQDDVRRGMPDILDMLAVCTSAGMSFDQSIQKISEYWNSTLGLEFKRIIQEMEMGVTRAEALRNMSNRLDVTELSSFVAVVIQAETLGMQISEVLAGQASQMRILRQLRAKELSNRLPATMIFPLVFFILPALFAVLLGPTIPNFMALMNFGK